VDASEIQATAAQAAHEAVRATFRLLGIDVDDQDSVNALRADLVFARDRRKSRERSAAFQAGLPFKFIGAAIIAAAALVGREAVDLLIVHFK
jgi:hypothetical protein